MTDKEIRNHWINRRFEEMEDKAQNMGLSWDGPKYVAPEEAYVRSVSRRLVMVSINQY